MPYVAPSTVVAGQTYGAAAHNVIVNDVIDLDTRVNDLIVSPVCQVIRSTDLTSYVSDAAIAWSSAPIDTDGMWSSGASSRITIQTAGIYLINLYSYISGSATITSIIPKIKINGNSVAEDISVVQGANLTVHTITLVLELAATNFIEFSAAISGGSAYIVNGAASDSFERTKATVKWLGRSS